MFAHCFFFFFFFQAEDGIRDHCVTGVQTCALPISDVENFPDVATTGLKAQTFHRLRIISALLKIFSRRSSRTTPLDASACFPAIGSIFKEPSFRTTLRIALDSSTRYSLALRRMKFHPSLSRVSCLSIRARTEGSETIRSPSHDTTAFVPAFPSIKKSTSNSPIAYLGTAR